MIFVKFIDAFFSQKVFKDTAIRRCYRYYRCHRGQCQAFVNRFLGTEIPRNCRWYHTRRMRYAYIRYKWWFNEYFLYDFNHFPNVKIPNYDACKNLCVRMAPRFVRIFRLISWDIALDENNKPVLIDVNLSYGQLDFHQMCNGPLFGESIKDILKLLPKE